MINKLEVASFVLVVLLLSAGVIIWDNWITPDAPMMGVHAPADPILVVPAANVATNVSDGWPDISSLFGELVKPVGEVQAASVVDASPVADSLVHGYDRAGDGYLVNGQVIVCARLDNLEGSALLAWKSLAPVQQADILTLCEAW